MRHDLSITTPDGTCPATLHTPEGSGPWPGVILFPDAGGARPTMAEMADHLAGMGYAVLLPDVYYRHGDWAPFDMKTAFSDEAERARLFSMLKSLTNEMVVADTEAFIEALHARPEVTDGPIGTTGYCMGGRISLTVAGHLGDKIGAAASFHGGGLADPDNPNSPHLRADKITATVYVAGAENDNSYTPEQAELLEQALTDAGVPHTLEFYPALHGFAVPDNPTYDPEAQKRHWAALEQLYATTLR
ncbi:carboxymethylenebutenolidase [Pseudonocardia thermophila]|jgi:Dienelactone hydrolase and related enzymes|uniref:Carboxymethylenebutenolidase n=1 Tax=Pseudonocardia thermophila TaxID=1848 RepID=A0A1M6N586_PSETH|nr:dienelactone hydrolase family protein [Pseudonocardia thermophila]SHJ90838.1 carboxymethylenebutenolidase [Pseudonocardia thermophila]